MRGALPFLLVGTYAKAGGEGVYPVTQSDTGQMQLGEAMPQAQNASFGCYSRRHRLHYLVDEGSEGVVGAYRWTGGTLERLASVPTHGVEPCYLSLDPGETCLAVANYGSGSCALLPLDTEAGLPTGEAIVRRNGGSGPVSARQDGPHAHCAVFSPAGDWLFQTDLGTDEVLAYAWDAESRQLGEAVVAYRAPPGSGPRHLLFNGDGSLAYLLSELSASLTVLRVEGERLKPRQILPLLDEPFDGHNLGGHLDFVAGGSRLLATNRGHDSIASFDILDDGTLRRGPLSPSGGRSPRFFRTFGDEMVIVNEESGSLRRLQRESDGSWSLAGGPLRVTGAAYLISQDW